MKIFVAKGKDGDSYYNASTDEALYANALWHLEHVTMEFIEWSEVEKDILKANEALELRDGKLAWKILQSRSRYEYEEVALETVFDVLDIKI